MLILLIFPYAMLNFFVAEGEKLLSSILTVLGGSLICLVLHIYRNRSAILEGIGGSLMLIAIVSLCSLIPVVGWIADVLIILSKQNRNVP